MLFKILISLVISFQFIYLSIGCDYTSQIIKSISKSGSENASNWYNISPSMIGTVEQFGSLGQVSPFTPVEANYEMMSRLKEFIGDRKFPKNKMLFLYAEPSGMADSNPPKIVFYFVTPPKSISIEDVHVKFNEKNISSFCKYCEYTEHGLEADFFIGWYEIKYCIDSTKTYTLEVTFFPRNKIPFIKKTEFRVPPPNNIKINDVSFFLDKSGKYPLCNKLCVRVSYPDEVKPDERWSNPENWYISYDDGSAKPVIVSIEMDYIVRLYSLTLNLEGDMLPHKDVTIYFSPFDGVYTEKYNFKTVGICGRIKSSK